MKNLWFIITALLLLLLNITAAPTTMRQFRAQEQFYIFAYGYGLSPQPKKRIEWKGWSREDVVSLMVPELFKGARQEFTLHAHQLGYADYLKKQTSWVEHLGSGSVLIRSNYEDTKISFKEGVVTAVETLCDDGSVTSHISYDKGNITELGFSWDGTCESMKSTPVYTIFYDYETGLMNKVEKRINGILDYWSIFEYSGDKLLKTTSYRKGKAFYMNRNFYTGARIDSSYTINEYDDTTVTRFQYSVKGYLAAYTYGAISGERFQKVGYTWGKKGTITSYALDSYYKGDIQQKTRTEFTYVNGRKTQELWVIQDGDQFEIVPTDFTYENGNLTKTAKHIAMDVIYKEVVVDGKSVTLPVSVVEQGQDFEFEWSLE